VKVSKTGFLEHLERVNLGASKRFDVRAQLVAEAKAKESFQGGVSTLLAVKTTPTGAVLFFDGKPLGRSDGTFDVPPGTHTLRASLVHFVKRCLDGNTEPIPETRIQLGKRLDEVFRNGRFPQADEAKAVFARWPPSPPGHPLITVAANVSETTGSLEDYRIEECYRAEANVYDWNYLPPITEGNEVSIHETTVLDSFLYAAMQRMLSAPDQRLLFPDFWPILEPKGITEQVEYVIIRPCVEHSMLGVIMGRGGGEELGNTLWGQTELSCYDDSFHGVWGM
jgi:hypothetical protein